MSVFGEYDEPMDLIKSAESLAGTGPGTEAGVTESWACNPWFKLSFPASVQLQGAPVVINDLRMHAV